jgi:hypothetical protein
MREIVKRLEEIQASGELSTRKARGGGGGADGGGGCCSIM